MVAARHHCVAAHCARKVLAVRPDARRNRRLKVEKSSKPPSSVTVAMALLGSCSRVGCKRLRKRYWSGVTLKT